ncbi:MAG TPA: hypothetical protein VMV20_08310 [Chitinophagaceae bacterium]|nr:hypothetical protein [Chitinophagaceae bacterium]
MASCSHKTLTVNDQLYQMQIQIRGLSDSIRTLRQEYSPGLGELMANIQLHHAKLWFSGLHSNWPLASYELGEIRESIGTAINLVRNRPEVSHLPMIYPALDSLTEAIALRRPDQFKNAFTLLTNTCNSCHQLVSYPFNVITIPTAPPVTNQSFMPPKP